MKNRYFYSNICIYKLEGVKVSVYTHDNTWVNLSPVYDSTDIDDFLKEGLFIEFNEEELNSILMIRELKK